MEEIKPEIYKYFADYVFKRTGIFYEEKDFYRLDKRIYDMMRKFDFAGPDDLYQAFKSNPPQELEMFLVDICTNNETYFFRDQKPFDALTEGMIPNLKDSLAGAPLKMWCCASSTGQEPMSIIMSIFEKIDPNFPFELEATDISTKALAKAKSALYTGLDVQRGLPIQLLMKYFESKEEGQWQAKPHVLNRVQYSDFNLFTGSFIPNKFHIIFCRNVLIYQNQENKKKILENLATCIKPGGYLVLGAGESLVGMDIGMKQITLANCMVFTKE